jgi:hypothetical protein
MKKVQEPGMYISFPYMSFARGPQGSSPHDITMLGLNFSEGKGNPIIVLCRKERYPEEWNNLMATVSGTHPMYVYDLPTGAPNDYRAIEHATKAIPYRLLSDPILALKELVVVIHLRPLEFQAGTSAAIFVDHRGMRGLLESHLGQRLDDRTAERLLFPSAVISVLKEGSVQSITDSISFINDPISYFAIRRLADFSLLNRQRMRIYFLDIMANKKLMRGGDCINMISTLERLKVSKGTSG